MIVIDAFITISPLLGLYSQYALMQETGSVGSFSIYYLAAIMAANILRICFWFSTGFANALLIQSILLVLFSLIVLNLCIKLGYKKDEEEGFWNWNSLPPFLYCTGIFAISVGIITSLCLYFGIENYGNVVGMVALSIQALAGFPLVYSNQKLRSVEGLSVFMVVTWLFCDFAKTLYFVIENQPFQFILCGATQVTIDVLLLLQIMIFKHTQTIEQESKQEKTLAF